MPRTILRHMVAIALLPGVVGAVVPVWIARRYRTPVTMPTTISEVAMVVLGGILLGVGVTLFAASLRRFATEGSGTLAPWDPPRRLVVRGPYRYVRNPMISGVIFVLAAEAAILRSIPHAAWALAFVAINLVYIPLLEEPMLHARFRGEYVEYRKHVPRFIPRLRPWEQQSQSSGTR